MCVHYEISPIKAFVHETALFDEDASKQGFVGCTVFAVSSYEGESPTFGIMLDDGSVFFYIPAHKLSLTGEELKYDLKDLVYHNCPPGDVVVNNFSIFKSVSVYLKFKDVWEDGKYICTFDWFQDNGLLHFIILKNGQFCFMPSHKVKFNGGEKSFIFYKKIHSVWKV